MEQHNHTDAENEGVLAHLNNTDVSIPTLRIIFTCPACGDQKLVHLSDVDDDPEPSHVSCITCGFKIPLCAVTWAALQMLRSDKLFNPEVFAPVEHL